MQDLGTLFNTLPDNTSLSPKASKDGTRGMKYVSNTPIFSADSTPRNRGRYQTNKASSSRTTPAKYTPKGPAKPSTRSVYAAKSQKPYINIEEITSPNKPTKQGREKQAASDTKKEASEVGKIEIENLGKSPLIVDPVLPILSPERFNLIMQAFNNMDKQQREFCRIRYEDQFKLAEEYFSEIITIPKITKEDTLTQVHIKYEGMRKDLVRAKMITRYKTVITAIWTMLEFFTVQVMGINIKGFTDMQSSLMPFYSSYIVSMADAEIEKNGIMAKDDSGLLYFVLICSVHFVVFVFISFMCKNPETASKIYSSITGNIVNMASENGEKVKPTGVGIKEVLNTLGVGNLF